MATLEKAIKLVRFTGEPYGDYIRRLSTRPRAKRVKIVDLRDNLKPSRRKAISDSLVRRYEKALTFLESI